MQRLLILLGVTFATASFGAAPSDDPVGWQLEQGVEPPSYAMTVPRSTNTNIDSVVLACEPAGARRVLQLQLYLTDDGPLLPQGARPSALKTEARAEVAVDDQVFAVAILFADDHAVLADAKQEMSPALSTGLIDAMTRGRTMILRFDLLAERPGRPAAFDGEAVIDLRAGVGGAAVAAVRRCATPASDPPNVARER